jgi:protein disulfide-isomerase
MPARIVPTSMKLKGRSFTVITLLAALVVAVAFSARGEAAGDGEANWHIDFEAAQAEAAASGKPLLLEFTGSDWCPPCMALNREVFSQDAFAAFADESLVLVKLDFPRAKEQSEATVAQNEALAERFGIRGFPTIVLLSPEGEEIARTGFRRGGAASYVQHLRSLLAEAD